MRVTTKGQVTIPQSIRKKYNITPMTEINFVEEKGRVYIVKKKSKGSSTGKFKKFRGVATVKLSTEEIMALTRGDK
jgi:AbrB family looped-hinge helix DNA binding protein